MARRSRKSYKYNKRQRETPRFSNRYPRLLPRKRQYVSDFRHISDKRLFHPDSPFKPTRYLSGQQVDSYRVPQRRSFPSRSPWKALSHGLAFGNPKRVLACVRRKIRREVIFAFRKAGKGAKSRNRRFNAESRISCRR